MPRRESPDQPDPIWNSQYNPSAKQLKATCSRTTAIANMTEEAEVQDFRLALSQQVGNASAGHAPPTPKQHNIASRSPQVVSSANVLLQVFFYKAADITGSDKPKLQNQILECGFPAPARALLKCTNSDQDPI